MLEIEKIVIDNTNSNAGIQVILHNPNTGDVKLEVRFSDGDGLEEAVEQLEKVLKEICVAKFEQLSKIKPVDELEIGVTHEVADGVIDETELSEVFMKVGSGKKE